MLFNNVPFDRKNDIILQRTYNREIQTTMSKKELKKLLILCTKNVHFNFGGKTLVQSYGLAMGSPLGPVLGDTFMLELKSTLVPMLTEYMKFWKRYVDDTICFVKMGSVQHIVSILNSFDLDIQFTNETEKKCR